MRKTEFGKNHVVKFLIWAFVPAYILQCLAAYFFNGGGSGSVWPLIVGASMYVPALAVILSGESFKGMGWRLNIRRNWKAVLFAWFMPLLLTVIGACLYFLVFPGHFDLSGQYMAAAGGGEALEQIKAQGISYLMYVLIGSIGAVTYAPVINALLAVGEEIGWRGFLYPQLQDRFGRKKGWCLGGLLWGAWHWPLIWLIGYEYGETSGNTAGYVGFPVSGMLVFCVITVGLGILHAWLYEKSGSIWLPAILHGAFNAAATIPNMLCLPDTGSARLLGPAPNGLIAGLPLLILAVLLLVTGNREQDKKAS